MSYNTSFNLAINIWTYSSLSLILLFIVLSIFFNIWEIILIPIFCSLLTYWCIFPIAFIMKFLDKSKIKMVNKTSYLCIVCVLLSIITTIILLIFTGEFTNFILNALIINIILSFIIIISVFLVMKNEWTNSTINETNSNSTKN